MTKKKSEPNPIEEAIGRRALTPHQPSDPTPPQSIQLNEPTDSNNPQTPGEIPDEPTPTEMVVLEELNRQTEERLLDNSEKPLVGLPFRETALKMEMDEMAKKKTIPVSKPDLQPVTKTSSLESPPQVDKQVATYNKTAKKLGIPLLDNSVEMDTPLQEIDCSCIDCGVRFKHQTELITHKCPSPKDKIEIDNLIKEAESPAEDKELRAMRDFIMGTSFVVYGVAMHIVALCSQPMTTPSTITWDFKDRAMIPDMVFALLKQPGYIEGIWPSLKVIMSSNVGNATWCAGIATTLAFFDVIRTLPALKELANEEDEKKS